MTSQDALKVLINHANISDEQKAQLAAAVDTMVEDDVRALGKALAMARKDEIEMAKVAIAKLDELIAVEPPAVAA